MESTGIPLVKTQTVRVVRGVSKSPACLVSLARSAPAGCRTVTSMIHWHKNESTCGHTVNLADWFSLRRGIYHPEKHPHPTHFHTKTHTLILTVEKTVQTGSIQSLLNVFWFSTMLLKWNKWLTNIIIQYFSPFAITYFAVQELDWLNHSHKSFLNWKRKEREVKKSDAIVDT